MAHDGATWLDRELIADRPEPLRDAGFGGEVRTAQALRRQWLIDQQLAAEVGDGTQYRPDMLTTLQRRELLRVAGQLSDELGLGFAEARSGDRIEGVFAALGGPARRALRRHPEIEGIHAGPLAGPCLSRISASQWPA